MNKLSLLIALSLALTVGCGTAEPTGSEALAVGVEDGCPAAPGYCHEAPFTQLSGPGFSTWASSDCTGEFARGPLSGGLPCAQWHQGADTEGDVYCVDESAEVPAIYFRDPNDGNACKAWTLTSERWFVWRWCGRHPLP